MSSGFSRLDAYYASGRWTVIAGLVSTLVLTACNDGRPSPAEGRAVAKRSLAELLDHGAELRRQAYYDSALVSLGAVIRGSYARGDSALVAEALVEYSKVLSITGQHKSALDSLQRISSLHDGTKNALRTSCDLIKARTHVRMGKPIEALSLLDQYRGSTEPEVFAIRGYAYYEADDYDESIHNLEKALRLLNSDSTDSVILQSRVTTNLALAWFNHSRDIIRTKSFLEETRNLRERVLRPDHPQLAEVAGNLGMLLVHVGLFSEARRNLMEAARIFERGAEESLVNLAVSYSNLGILYQEAGDFEVARAFLHRSLEIREARLGSMHPRLYYTYTRLARLHLAINEPRDALKFCRKAVRVVDRLGKTGLRRKGTILVTIAEAHSVLGQTDSAFVHYSQALDLLRRHGQAHHVATAYASLGRSLKANQQWNLAKKFLRRARSLMETVQESERLLLIEILNDLAEIEIEAGSQAYALELTSEALHENHSRFAVVLLGKEYELPLSLEQSLRSLVIRSGVHLRACQFLQTNDDCSLSDLLQDLQKIANLLDAIRRDVRTIESKRFWLRQSRTLVRELIQSVARLARRYPSPELIASLFELIEVTRAGILVDRVYESDGDNRSEHPAKIMGSLAALRHQLRMDNLQLSRTRVPTTRDSLHQRIANQRLQYDQLLRNIEIDYPAYYAMKYGTDVVDTPNASRYVDDNEAIIEYYVDGDSLYTITVTSSEWHFTSTAWAPVEQAVVRLQESLSHSDYEMFVTAASDLYVRLVSESERLIDDKYLIIIPDDILHHVPFEALLYEPPPPSADYAALPYLVNRHAISYSYSATLRRTLGRRDREKADRAFIGIAPVDYDGGRTVTGENRTSTPSLPGAASEVRQLRNLFSPTYNIVGQLLNRSTSIALGDDANEEAVMGSGLGRYRYVHFATHGKLDNLVPELSGLLLHPSSKEADDVLHLGEIYALDLNADLVVLSACDTGQGRLVAGEGVVGLTGGLLYAGARNVVVSLWQVEDSAAGTLMVPFYTRFLKREHYRNALQGAKLELIKSGGKYAQPYFWAPYILFDS